MINSNSHFAFFLSFLQSCFSHIFGSSVKCFVVAVARELHRLRCWAGLWSRSPRAGACGGCRCDEAAMSAPRYRSLLSTPPAAGADRGTCSEGRTQNPFSKGAGGLQAGALGWLWLRDPKPTAPGAAELGSSSGASGNAAEMALQSQMVAL